MRNLHTFFVHYRAAIALAAVLLMLTGFGGFWWYEISAICMLFAIGLVLTGATTMAMNLGRQCAGAASAVVGGIGYIAGGLVPPLVNVGNILVTSFALCCLFLTAGVLLSCRAATGEVW